MNVTRPTGHAPQSRLAFNGERPEPLLGDYALGAGHRLYSPVLQRFHSADRLSPFDEGGINGYGYCLGDPLNNLDPSGNIAVFVNSFRYLLQKTQAFWRGSVGTVVSMTTSQKPDIATYQIMAPSTAALRLPTAGSVILPSTSIPRPTSPPVPGSGLVHAPSARLAKLMERANGWGVPPTPPRFSNGSGRMWMRAGPPTVQHPSTLPVPNDPPVQHTLSYIEMRLTSLKWPIRRAVLARAADGRAQAHRDEMFGPWWKA